MCTITLDRVLKRYGGGAPVVQDVSLHVDDGEFVILVGPSGSGKSTLLRMIAGLEDITSGELRIDDARSNEKAPRERDLAMVFQNYALYPHLDVFENIAFPLRLRKTNREEVQRKVGEVARLLELGDLLERRPSQLSGGQRQRVAMGRAIVRQARAFLFDEPLSNLDARLRLQMRADIARLQRRLGVTTVYVTHDQVEAMTLGDRVAVLRRGVLQQVDAPRELYESPVNMFVAGFIGSPPMNFVPGTVTGRELLLPFAKLELAQDQLHAIDGRSVVVAGIRPEHLEAAPPAGPEARRRAVRFLAPIDVTEWLGPEQFAYLPYEAPGDVIGRLRTLARELDSEWLRTQLVISLDAETRIRAGERAELWLDPTRMHLFDPASGDNLTRGGHHRAGTRVTPE
jgi:multiple sugar transport system ATP-binding protein